jgi:glycosyltransferase involved in cell wall biosynthesis
LRRRGEGALEGQRGREPGVVVITTVHRRNDTRIVLKELREIRRLRCSLTLIVADGKGDVEKGGVHVVDLGRIDSSRSRRWIIGTFRLAKKLVQLRPAVIHFHDPELMVVAIFGKMLGATVIYDVHEDLPRQVLSKEWIPRMARRPTAMIVRCAEVASSFLIDRIIAATPSISERFPRKKTVVVQNYPLIAELSAGAGERYSDREMSVVFVGGLTCIRGAREIVQALGLVDNALGIKLHVAGTIQPAALQRELANLDEWKHVIFHGALDRPQVAALMGRARAGLVTFHPAPNHMESQPTKLFEYMTAGLPVIASDFPLWRTIIDGAGCGLLVDPLNPASIAEAMEWIVTNPESAAIMGKRAQEAAEHRYNWETEAHRLRGMYHGLGIELREQQ